MVKSELIFNKFRLVFRVHQGSYEQN